MLLFLSALLKFVLSSRITVNINETSLEFLSMLSLGFFRESKWEMKLLEIGRAHEQNEINSRHGQNDGEPFKYREKNLKRKKIAKKKRNQEKRKTGSTELPKMTATQAITLGSMADLSGTRKQFEFSKTEHNPH